MIAPDLAGKLLDDVVYDRLRSHIDLRSLERFELELFASITAFQSETAAATEARRLVDGALARFVADPDRYASFAEVNDPHCVFCGVDVRAEESRS